MHRNLAQDSSEFVLSGKKSMIYHISLCYDIHGKWVRVTDNQFSVYLGFGRRVEKSFGTEK